MNHARHQVPPRALSILVCTLLFWILSLEGFVSAAQAQSQTVQRVGTRTCLLDGATWKPATRVARRWRTIENVLLGLAAQYSTAGLRNKGVIRYQMRVLRGQLKSAAAGCSRLGGSSNLASINLTKIPSPSELFRSATGASTVGTSAVSGTPPTLGDIPSVGAENVFWRPGVVAALASGTATSDQCNEFFGSNADGSSSGQGACYTTMNLGGAVQEILRSGTTLCYMKRAPTQTNLAAGAVTVVGGTLPAGGINNLMATPSGGSARLIQVSVPNDGPGERIFIRIASQNTNASNNHAYAMNFWACTDGAVQEYETTSISNAGVYSTTSANQSENGIFNALIQARLVSNGTGGFTFDTTASRTAETVYVYSNSFSNGRNRSQITLTPNNEIFAKANDSWGSDGRKAYSVGTFTGSSALTLRFLAGAVKQEFLPAYGSQVPSAFEYRDTAYLASPANSYLPTVSAVDFSSDTFYSTIPTPTYDTSPYDCNATADVSLSMDFSRPELQAVEAVCDERLENMNFCRTSQVEAASLNWISACVQN